MDQADLDLAEELARDIAAIGLPGARVAAWPTQALSAGAWQSLMAAVRRNRIIGLVAQAVAEGRLPVDTAQAAAVDGELAEAMATAVVLEQLLVRASRCLDAAGVRHWVLKGPANAHLDWPNPMLRPFNDIDLLLDHTRFAEGTSALVASGLRRRAVEVRAGWDAQFGKGTTLVGEGGFELDVHRLLVAGAFGFTVDPDDLVAADAAFEVGGQALFALGRPQRCLHACYHAALGDARPRLLTQRDVIEALLGLDDAGTRTVIRLAQRWRAAAPVSRALTAAVADLRLTLDHPMLRWAAAYRPSPGEARTLRAYTGDDRTFGAQAIEGLLTVPTLGGKGRYAFGLLFPVRDHMESRHERVLTRWRRGLRLLVRQLARS